MTLRTPVQPSEKLKATLVAVRVIADRVNLPPRSTALVPVVTDVVTCGKVVLGGNVQLLLGIEIGVAGGLTEFQGGQTVVHVTNFRQETRHLTKDAAVGHAEELRNSVEAAAIAEESSPPQPDSTAPAQLDIGPKLPLPKRRKLINLLA